MKAVTMRRILAAALMAILALTLACGRFQPPLGGETASAARTASPSPSLSPSPIQDDVAAVTAVVQMIYGPTDAGSCISSGPRNRYVNCPMTPAVQTALDHLYQNVVGICRCQNPWQSMTVAVVVVGTQEIAQVDLYFGLNAYRKFDLYVSKQSSNWVVTDIRCRGGDASTSIFAQPPPPVCTG